MSDLIVLISLSVYAVLFILAFLKKNPVWKVISVGALLTILAVRELSIYAFMLSKRADLAQQGLLSEGIAEGVSYILDETRTSGVIVLFIYLTVFVLCFKGFHRPLSKPKTDTKDQHGDE